MKATTEIFNDHIDVSNLDYDWGDDEGMGEDDFPLLSDLQFVASEEIFEQLAMPAIGARLL